MNAMTLLASVRLAVKFTMEFLDLSADRNDAESWASTRVVITAVIGERFSGQIVDR